MLRGELFPKVVHREALLVGLLLGKGAFCHGELLHQFCQFRVIGQHLGDLLVGVASGVFLHG